MVAHVDSSDCKCRCIGKIIARDLKLVASRLYEMRVTRPWTRHVPCHYTCTIHVSQKNQRKDGNGGREIQEALSVPVHSQGAKTRHPVTPFVTRRAGSSHSGFPCGPPSAATTAVAPCLLIQPARVTTSAGSRCRIHRSLWGSSQQTGAHPRLLGGCHDNRLLASSHHVVPELVSPGEVCPTTVQKLH